MLQSYTVIKGIYHRQCSRLSFDRLLRVQRVTDFPYSGNLTLELIVFELSYL